MIYAEVKIFGGDGALLLVAGVPNLETGVHWVQRFPSPIIDGSQKLLAIHLSTETASAKAES